MLPERMQRVHEQLPLEEEQMIDDRNFSRKDREDNSHLMWETGERRQTYKCAIFSVNEVERKCHDGRKGNFIEIECPEWIIIIPLYRDEDGVLRTIVERQYRHGSDSVTLEFPAGLVEKGEEPIDAARRELLEETGFKAGKVTKLATLCPNNAFMSNHQHIYLAEDLELVSGQDLDANEEIDLYSLPLSEVLERMGRGSADNALMVAATSLLMRELDSRKEEL